MKHKHKPTGNHPPTRLVTFRLRRTSRYKRLFLEGKMRLIVMPYTLGELYYVHVIRCKSWGIEIGG